MKALGLIQTICLCTLQDVIRLVACKRQESNTTDVLPTGEGVLIIDEVKVNI